MTRIIQVGMGGFGRNWAELMIPQVTEVEVVACVDQVPAALDATVAAGLMPKERCYGSLTEALTAHGEADAVLVTASLEGHVPSAREALLAGKHVMTEKPFAPTLAEAQSLIDLAAQQQRVMMVSQNYRFFPAVRAVQSIVQKGELGELHAVGLDFRKMSGGTGNRPHFRLAEPLLVDMSIHHFDLFRAVLGRNATAITCRTWNPSWTSFAGPPEGVALLHFEGGLTASYRGSWVSNGAPTLWAGEWRMDFEEGEVWWTSRGDGPKGSESDRVLIRRHGSAEAEEVVLPDIARTDRAGSLTEFVTAIAEGRPGETTGSDNINSLAVTYAATASAASGLTESIPVA
jgi:predicted dehydrogenase